jgi:MerR family transcriptional regulator, light-induced transcriptional regulator
VSRYGAGAAIPVRGLDVSPGVLVSSKVCPDREVTAHLNISALSTRTGVAPDTLRKWERRYGVLSPARTAGGQRRYSVHDVARVAWLRDRLAEGWRIGEAARVLRERDAPAPTEPLELRRALVDAAGLGSPAIVDGLLDQVFAMLAPKQAFSEVLGPALVDIGTAWHEGRLSVADEHSFTAKLRGRLEHLMVDERPALRGTAVLACAPREQHELGLMMLAVELRADGWRVEYLGAATPVSAAADFSERSGASLLGFSVSRAQTASVLADALRKLRTATLPPIAIGGSAADSRVRMKGVEIVDGDAATAVELLRQFGPQ